MLQSILVCLKSLSEYYQMAHWQSKGENFYEYHLLFERLYGSAGDSIDAVAEKLIGIGEGQEKLNLPEIIKQQYSKIKMLPVNASAEAFLNASIGLENELCAKIEEIEPSYSVGVRNMLGDIADKAEGRKYLIKQCLNKIAKPIAI